MAIKLGSLQHSHFRDYILAFLTLPELAIALSCYVFQDHQVSLLLGVTFVKNWAGKHYHAKLDFQEHVYS